jgi:hypothetical protein
MELRVSQRKWLFNNGLRSREKCEGDHGGFAALFTGAFVGVWLFELVEDVAELITFCGTRFRGVIS